VLARTKKKNTQLYICRLKIPALVLCQWGHTHGDSPDPDSANRGEHSSAILAVFLVTKRKMMVKCGGKRAPTISPPYLRGTDVCVHAHARVADGRTGEHANGGEPVMVRPVWFAHVKV
jgi:hypothetical protein